MAAIAGVDYTGALTISQLQNVTNINTNTGSAGLNVADYEGNLTIITSCGGGVSGTVIVPSLKAGPDTSVSNATNWVLNLPNFAETAGRNVANVDLRSSAFGATGAAVGPNKFLYLTWLITGSATANSAIDCWVIGQKKYSS
jgi:hypothetical protein